MKRYPFSYSSRRLSRHRLKFTQQQLSQLPNALISEINRATLLASKSSLREAILVREILGQPRGLQAIGQDTVVVALWDNM